MLHELLLGCLGFTGDIISEYHGTFKVKEGFDLLTEAEREQSNKIASLGWFYTYLSKYIDAKSLNWDSNKSSQLYQASFSVGLNDYLEEYTQDLSNLELLIINEGPIPLSYIITNLQKVNYIFIFLFQNSLTFFPSFFCSFLFFSFFKAFYNHAGVV